MNDGTEQRAVQTARWAMRHAVEVELGPLGVSTARCDAIAGRLLESLQEAGWVLVVTDRLEKLAHEWAASVGAPAEEVLRGIDSDLPVPVLDIHAADPDAEAKRYAAAVQEWSASLKGREYEQGGQ